MILILSNEQDPHARAVSVELAALGSEPWLLDLSRFPVEARLSLRYGAERDASARYDDGGGGTRDLRACRSVWWRRPQPFRIDPLIRDRDQNAFAFNECREVFSGLWHLLDAFWINDPVRDDVGHKKTYQLDVAMCAGLSVPETLVTNDPEQAREFVGRHGVGKTVYKVFSASPRLWRETRAIREDELGSLDLVRLAPVIFQEFVAGMDIRVTIVGEQVFAAEIDVSGGDYPVDFRMNPGRTVIRPTSLPPGVEGSLRDLMTRLGLVYGAIDLRRTEEGRHVFLEVNPAGQWLFVEEQTGQPITRALANLLRSKDLTRADACLRGERQSNRDRAALPV